MKSTRILSRSIVTLLALTAARHAHAQFISISAPTTYTQNFDSLGVNTNLWADGFTLPGWYAGINNNATADGNLQVTDGAVVLSGLLNLGSNGAADRALGSKATGTNNFANIAYGVLFQNTSPDPLKILTIGYTGELWRTNDGAANIERWDTYYKISSSLFLDVEPGANSATPNQGSFTSFDALDWVAPSNAPVNAQVNGNTDQYRTVLGASPSLTLQPGEFFMFRWVDTNLAGVDGYQGIDDFSITFSRLITPTGRTLIYNILHEVGGAPNGVLADSAAQYWINSEGGAMTGFTEGDSVVFADAATATIDVPAAVQVDTLAVTADSGTYTIGGAGGVIGKLQKSGAGGLVLTGSNSFTTATYNAAGSLVIQGSTSFESLNVIGAATIAVDGPVTITALSMDAGLTLNSSVLTTVNGPVSGAGPLIKSGAGTLNLGNGTVGNSYSGLTHVQAGTLIAAGPANVVTIPGDLTLENGAIFRYAGNTQGNQIADSATVTINGGSFGDLANGPTNPGAPETVTNVILNGGTFSTGRALFTASNNFTQTSGRTLIHRAGTLVVGGAMTVQGILEMDGGATGQVSALNIGPGGLTLNDATVRINTTISGLDAEGDSTGSTISLNGNVIATGTNVIQRMDTGTTRTQRADLDLQGFDRTFDVTGILTIGTTGAAVSIVNGGITKTGSGLLMIRGDQNYTGATTVNGGTLRVEGSLGSAATVNAGNLVTAGSLFGAVTVNGGVLSGNGTATSVTVNAGGTVQAGIDGAGVLNINTLSLQAGSSVTVQQGAFPPLLAVTGVNGLTAAGPAGSVLINLAGAPTVGQVTAIDYEGTLTGDFGTFALGILPNRTVATLINDLATSAIKIDVTAVDQPVWTGNASTEWSTAAIANPKNWVLSSNTTSGTDFLVGDHVIFADLGDNVATRGQVDISVDDVSPGSMVFNNTLFAYTINGSRSIVGSGGLTKQGTQSLTINTTNSFTGAVAINGGSVVVDALADAGAPSALGAGNTISFNGGALELTAPASSTNRTIVVAGTGGAILLPANGVLTLTGGMTGTGALAVVDGRVEMAGVSGFNGTLTAQGGTIRYTGNSIGGNSMTVGLTGGTLENNDVAEAIFNNAATILRSLQVSGSNTIDVLNPTGIVTFDRPDGISGDGTIIKTGPGNVRVRAAHNALAANWVLEEGIIEPDGPANTTVAVLGNGTVTVNGGMLGLRNLTLPNAVTFNGGILGTRSGDAGTLSGPVNVDGTMTVALRSFTTLENAQTITISGPLGGAGTITVEGNNPSAGKAFVLTNPGGTFSGSILVTPNQMVTLRPTFAGNPLGTGSVTLDTATLNISDDGAGSNTVLAYGNALTITGAGTSTLNVVAGPFFSTGNTVQLGALTVGDQTFQVTGAGSYRAAFNGTTTLTGAATFQPTTADLLLTGDVTGNFGFTKTGAGRMVIESATTFVGGVTLSEGTLVMNGSTVADSDVTVNAGTLAGLGTIGGDLNVAGTGTVNPGDPVAATLTGVLTVDGNLGLASGTTLAVNLTHSLANPDPVAGSDYDQLNVGFGGSSTVSLGNATLTINVGAGLVGGDIFFIVLNNGTNPVSGTFAGLADDTNFIVGSVPFQISYDANSVTGTIDGGNDVALMVVPEPGSALLMGGGLFLLAAGRRRRTA